MYCLSDWIGNYKSIMTTLYRSPGYTWDTRHKVGQCDVTDSDIGPLFYSQYVCVW